MASPLSLNLRYRAESVADRIICPLDSMTLIFQKRSGITHIVADPVPQILQVMGDGACDAAKVAERLALEFDLDDGAQAKAIIADRLEELAAVGFVERIDA
jgi:PqqD family protein of HPr-rel-A system